MADEWLVLLQRELGLSTELNAELILDVARAAAHGVERRAAPLTTYLLGVVAAERGPEGARLAAATITRLAREWQQSHGEPAG
jgi:hypothetical protein